LRNNDREQFSRIGARRNKLRSEMMNRETESRAVEREEGDQNEQKRVDGEIIKEKQRT